MTIHSFFENYGNTYFNDLDMSKLLMDRAYLMIDNIGNKEAYLYSTYKDCVNCPFFDEYGNISDNMTDVISTEREKIYKVLTDYVDLLPSGTNDNVLCNISTEFGEFGVYQLLIGERNCTLNVLKEPVNIYLPIFTIFCICTCLFGAISLSRFLLKVFLRRHSANNMKDVMDVGKERIQSLDTFRGIAIGAMIFINYGGGEYKFVDHAIWNGLHIADLVFPWFLWIMGFCIPVTVKAMIKRNDSTKTVLLSVTRRTMILFAIGTFLSSGTNLNDLRIFGILQRIGICYFVTSLLYYTTIKMYENEQETFSDKSHRTFSDIVKIKSLWMIMILILAIHNYALFFVPFGNCPSGYLGPGGYHENGKYQNCTGGITGYIDRLILGNYIFKWSTIRTVYHADAIDPEGIFSTLTAIIQVFFGIQASNTFLTYKDHKSRLLRWLIWSIIFSILGGILCGFSKENGLIPLNSNLWSISYVFVTSGLAFLILSACYVLIDVQKVWSGKPFIYAGKNAIFLYIGHTMAYNNIPFHWYFDDISTHFIRLLANVFATIFWFLIAFVLYKKKAFLTI